MPLFILQIIFTGAYQSADPNDELSHLDYNFMICLFILMIINGYKSIVLND